MLHSTRSKTAVKWINLCCSVCDIRKKKRLFQTVSTKMNLRLTVIYIRCIQWNRTSDELILMNYFFADSKVFCALQPMEQFCHCPISANLNWIIFYALLNKPTSSHTQSHIDKRKVKNAKNVRSMSNLQENYKLLFGERAMILLERNKVKFDGCNVSMEQIVLSWSWNY